MARHFSGVMLSFNSKISLRDFATKYNYNIPLGVEIKTPNDFDLKISELKNFVSEKGIDNDKVKVWCKLESQSSGTGTISFEGLNTANIEKLKKKPRILILTGSSKVSFTLKQKNFPEYDILMKPVDFTEVHHSLNKVLAIA